MRGPTQLPPPPPFHFALPGAAAEGGRGVGSQGGLLFLLLLLLQLLQPCLEFVDAGQLLDLRWSENDMAKWMGESVRQSSQPNCVSPFSPSFLYSSVTHVGASVVLIHLLPRPETHGARSLRWPIPHDHRHCRAQQLPHRRRRINPWSGILHGFVNILDHLLQNIRELVKVDDSVSLASAGCVD